MTAWLKFVPSWAYWVLALVLVAGGQQVRVLSAQSVASKAQAEHQTHLRQVAEANAAVIRKQQADRLDLERRLAKADQHSTEKLTHALTENDRLERLYSSADDERRRLRIEVRVAHADAVVSSTSGSGGMGDAARLELSSDAGQSVWDIRAEMINDRAKIEYLQGYVCSVSPGAPGCMEGD